MLGVGVRVCIDNNHKRLRRAFFKLFSRSEPLPSRRRYTGRAKPTLMALDAIVHTRGPAGERQILMAEFHLLPAEYPERESVLQHGELVTAVTLPARPQMVQSRYLKVRDRASYAFALTSAAATLHVEGGKIREARLALGGVGTKPWRALEAERALIGQRPDAPAFARAAEAALADARPRKHNAFKVELARRTIVRTLATVRVAG